MKVFRDFPLRVSFLLILGLIVTLLCGLIYMTAFQIYRNLANDPQIQISEDMAGFLATGKDVNSVMPPMEADIAKSLVWFLTVYNDSGEIVATNGKLDGVNPVLPQGVLEHAKQNGQNRVTWEPKDGVRIAAVVTKYEGGYVLAGRNLRETEERIEALGKKVFATWFVIMILTFGGVWLLIPYKKSH